MDKTQLAHDFEDYANSFGRGFLKYYKAFSMLETFRQMPSMLDDEVRFLAYLKSCLKMEGFFDTDIELIMGWIYERKDAL